MKEGKELVKESLKTTAEALFTIFCPISIGIVLDIWLTRLFVYKPVFWHYLFPWPLVTFTIGGLVWLVIEMKIHDEL